MHCFFVSDLHGNINAYRKLFDLMLAETPDAVFLGGDLLPHPMDRRVRAGNVDSDFLQSILIAGFANVKIEMGDKYPEVYIIMGNDDTRSDEKAFIAADESGLWHYMHKRRAEQDGFEIIGYSHIPPSPFLLKDWERYDVSRFIDPGCVSPEEGFRTVEMPESRQKYDTILNDMNELFEGKSLSKTIVLFHCPPHKTLLDRADLDGRMVDHTPVDVNIGSIAIRRTIEQREPYLTLHGHVHEATRLTGSWRDKIGRTHMFNAAHDGRELSLVRFDTDNLDNATREIIATVI